MRETSNVRTRRIVAMATEALTAGLVFVAIGGGVVLLLWNWLLPPLFAWPQLTFWQALGILALCRILFGGFGDPTKGRRRTAERWDRLTPEERDRLRQGTRGPGSPSVESGER